jgi:hypothetical protein
MQPGRIKMQPLDNPVAMFPEGPNLDAQRLLVCTAVHGYTVGCYPYYRLLMRTYNSHKLFGGSSLNPVAFTSVEEGSSSILKLAFRSA